jgi:hypothetical protein
MQLKPTSRSCFFEIDRTLESRQRENDGFYRLRQFLTASESRALAKCAERTLHIPTDGQLGLCSRIVRPHTQDANRFLFGKDLIHDAVLNIDAARKCAGPTGAGKTTFARAFLPEEAQCPHFINADLIAAGLSPFAPESTAVKAGA